MSVDVADRLRRLDPRHMRRHSPPPTSTARSCQSWTVEDLARLGITSIGRLDPGALIGPVPREWRMPERLDEDEPADWRAGRNAVYQLAALTIGAHLAVAEP